MAVGMADAEPVNLFAQQDANRRRTGVEILGAEQQVTVGACDQRHGTIHLLVTPHA